MIYDGEVMSVFTHAVPKAVTASRTFIFLVMA